MLRFILRRLALVVPTLLILSAATFFLGLLAPLDPITIMMGQHADEAREKRLRHQFGLDRPPLIQYADFVARAIRGDFGLSYTTRRPVVADIALRYPATATLAGCALLFAVGIGVPLGFFASIHQNSLADRACVGLSVLAVSVPAFVVGPLLLLMFALQLKLVPVAFGGQPADFILPAITLGARPMALIARMTRASMLDTLRQDFVRTALAKGLSRGNVLVRHAFRNALIPVLTVIGTSTGYLLGGSFVVETVFGIPGIGRASIEAIKLADYPVVQAVVLIAATAFVLVNLLVDVLYGFANPRIRTAASSP